MRKNDAGFLLLFFFAALYTKHRTNKQIAAGVFLFLVDSIVDLNVVPPLYTGMSAYNIISIVADTSRANKGTTAESIVLAAESS